MKHVGMYIHIPFCKKKCDYCDFSSCDNKINQIPTYIKYLKQEIQDVGEGIKLDAQEGLNDWVTIDTIYIGGGTPSFIDSKYIQEILETVKQYFVLDENVEITIEMNPGTVNIDKLKEYKESGINRCSIGLQATRDDLLKDIGRIHNVEEFIKTYEDARKVGFDNINIDFIIGLPNQTLEDIEDILELVSKLKPEHVSVYSLIVEDNTKLKEKIEQGKLTLPSDDLEREMYWNIKKGLENLEYGHYEISNFAKNGCESKHNLDCWNQKEYIGFGSSAHSYTDNVRYSNIDDLDEFISNFEKDKLEDNIIFHEKQNEKSKMKEYMILGLRKIDGISKEEFHNKFKMNFLDLYEAEIEKLVKQGLVEVTEDRIKLTCKGIDFANLVWEEFV